MYESTHRKYGTQLYCGSSKQTWEFDIKRQNWPSVPQQSFGLLPVLPCCCVALRCAHGHGLGMGSTHFQYFYWKASEYTLGWEVCLYTAVWQTGNNTADFFLPPSKDPCTQFMAVTGRGDWQIWLADFTRSSAVLLPVTRRVSAASTATLLHLCTGAISGTLVHGRWGVDAFQMCNGCHYLISVGFLANQSEGWGE